MKGKKGLIMGVANERSIAWGISQKLTEAGAELAFTYPADALKKRVIPLAEKLNSKVTFSCDVEKKEDVTKLFEDIKSQWGQIDFVVHAVAFSDKSELSGEYLDTTRENFLRSMLISCFSFTEVSKEAAKIMKLQKRGGQILFNISKQTINPGSKMGAYGLPKATTMFLMRQLALELGNEKIRVNGINADRIRSGLLTDNFIKERSMSRGISEQVYMEGNLLQQEVEAKHVGLGFTALAQMKRTTGHILTVDGGNTAAELR